MKIKNLSLALALLITFAGCEQKSTNDTDLVSAPKVDKTLQKTVDKQQEPTLVKKDFTLKTIDGKEIVVAFENEGKKIFIKNEEYKNKVILLDFFASWCPPCKAEIPHLNNLRKKYNGKFEIIGVLLEDGKPHSEIQSFIDEFEIKYPIMVDADNRAVANVFGGVRSIPFMVMYTPKGEYSTHYMGAVPEEMIDTNIQDALGILK